MKNLQTYLDESLLRHICIELKDEDIVYEKYGEYDGCRDLADYIITQIKELNKSQNIVISYDDVKDIDNICFDKLTISYIKGNNVHASYFINKKSTFSAKTCRFSESIIQIEFDNYDDEIHSILEHELTHLYNDWLLQSKGLKTFFDIFHTKEYEGSKKFKNKNQPLPKRELQRALYILNDFEKNAFIGQLMDQIQMMKSKWLQTHEKLDANKLLIKIKSLSIYKAYYEINNFILRYKNNQLFEYEKNNIIEEWESMHNEKLSLDKIFKQLEYKFIKTKNKIESLIPKKIAESYGKNIILMDENIDLLDLSLK